tara:strand:- start:41 stop:604 length:564 start_codon:yes stop_codon:yes gene_type:complete
VLVLQYLNEVVDIGKVRFACEDDLPYINDLSKKESKSLGFIPNPAYLSAITGIKTGKRWSLICNDKLFVCECNEELVGFCLASFGHPQRNVMTRTGKISQICLQTDARMLQRGRVLLDEVLAYGESVYTFNWSCGCADDLESNIFWRTMGWNKVNQRKGISHKNTWKQTSKRNVNIYMFSKTDFFIK